jgi:uncharacterized repeat protein (TIGR03803 family)
MLLLPARGEGEVFEEFGLIQSRFEPYGDLVNPGDGHFYGAARWAEVSKGGVIYRVAPGQDAEVVHQFGAVADGSQTNYGGSNPCCPMIIGHDGAFYGATDAGGANGLGTVYRISPDGIFSVLRDTELGDGFIWSMIATPDGGLMAATYDSGPEGGGCLYTIAPDGIFRRVSSFQKGPSFPPMIPVPEGTRVPFRNPSKLLVGSDERIYGTFASGGLIHPHGTFRFSYGGMFRHDGPGAETVLYENPRVGDRAYPELAVEGGFMGITGDKLVRISLEGGITTLARFMEPPRFPSISVAQGDAVYGMSFYGGAHLSGYVFRHTPAEGIVILHHFTRDYYTHQRALVAGNDGMVYGIAALPQGAEPVTEDPVAEVAAVAGRRASPKPKKGSSAYATRAFRFKPPGASSNFGPVAKPDVAWLPPVAVGGVRSIEVDVLKNDRDPDGDPLTLEGPAEDVESGSVTVVDTPKGKRLRISTSEADPAGRLIPYRVSDGRGGFAIGRLAVRSPVTGKFAGLASGPGGAAGPLVVSIGKKQNVAVKLKLNGRSYSGKGLLDIDETGDIPLKGPKGAPPLTLHLDLRRLPQRHLQAIVVAEGTTYTATCTLPEPK